MLTAGRAVEGAGVAFPGGRWGRQRRQAATVVWWRHRGLLVGCCARGSSETTLHLKNGCVGQNPDILHTEATILLSLECGWWCHQVLLSCHLWAAAALACGKFDGGACHELGCSIPGNLWLWHLKFTEPALHHASPGKAGWVMPSAK